ncbi:MAG TPA: zinc ribbon domain-containing protein [Methanomassiliicoccales archaeon]|nr:zinc ribbon domain-containing protein [Methanomassiliicoccales archaeon]HOO03735.1 zinc ribbon domain-containing protein [Methanomassiliicoccales archaeon]
MPQVQHDAILAGGALTIIGGLLMLMSAFMPWVSMQDDGQWTLWALDLLQRELLYTVIPAASTIGAALVTTASLVLYRVFESHRPLKALPIIQALMAMASSLLAIASIILLNQEYQGTGALYGAGAFTSVVGAILVMAGALLTHAMSGRRPKASPTGFQALAARSKGPVGRREWKPPETAVKAPRCPSCGEELRPGWKACPNCGYALISEEREGKGSL